MSFKNVADYYAMKMRKISACTRPATRLWQHKSYHRRLKLAQSDVNHPE